MLVIALTGGIGAGKSSAGSLLSQLGAVHVSADQLAREVLERGEEGYNQVIAQFGDGILSSGEIDRQKLAELVFNDSTKREELEKITHPLIYQRFKTIRKSLPENSVLIYEIPLLVESAARAERVNDFDLILSIETAEEIRVQRLTERGFPLHQIRARIAAQSRDEERRAIAHHVIENNGDRESLLRSLEQWWDEFVAPKIPN
jgi:dephospho-CoA kinase